MTDLSPLQINLGLAPGWAYCRLRQGEQELEFCGSFLIDSFAGLLSSVVAVADGADSAEAIFDFDPIYYRWLVERAGSVIRCSVVECCDDRGTDRLLFRGAAPARELAQAVLDQFAWLAEGVGAERYRAELRGRTFPTAGVAALLDVVRRLSETPPNEPIAATPPAG